MTGTNRATVSLCMIVRNEERQLADCLTPVASLFDEIVVVDTGSVDATRQVAARFTPQVFDFPWCDDFSAARNESLRRAQGNWIFWLDADDRIDAENVAGLRSLLAGLADEPRAYLMNTVCSSRYACEGVNLVTHPRLFRRHADLHWKGRVHEQLRPEWAALGYETVWSDVLIRHVGYEDAAMRQRKLNRDVRLLRMDYAVNPDDSSTLVHLGMAYFHLGRWEQSREFLRKVLAATHGTCDHLRQVFGVLATMAMREGKLHEALATLDQALMHFPGGEYLLYLQAECLYELDRYTEAKSSLAKIINGSSEPQYRGGVPAGVREKLAPRRLADIFRLERDFASAEALALSIVDRFGEDTHSWHTLGRVYLDSRQQVKLLSVVERLRSCPQGEIFASLLLAIWHLTQRELDIAGQHIERLISLAPQMPMPRILRVEWLTQTGAAIAERIQACRDVLRVHPAHLDAQRVLDQLELVQRQSVATPSDTWSTSVVLGEGLPGGVASA